MAWEKSPEELAERFGRVLERFPDAERRKMFGYPAAFVAGNMVTGLHQSNWVVRLPEGQQAEAMADGSTAFDPMGGRPMKNFVALPADVIADDERLAPWVEPGDRARPNAATQEEVGPWRAGPRPRRRPETGGSGRCTGHGVTRTAIGGSQRASRAARPTSTR